MRKAGLVETLLALLMVALVVVVFVQVALRYLTYQPLAWTEELARFVFIWLSLLGAAIGARRGAHFAVDMLGRSLAAGPARLLRIALRCGEAAIYAILAWGGCQILAVVHPQQSITLDLPMSLPYAAIPVGAALMCAYTLALAFRDLTRKPD